MTTDPMQQDLSATRAEPPRMLGIPSELPIPVHTVQTIWRQIAWGKILLFSTSLFFFILAITLMKEGARGLGVVVGNHFSVTNAFNSLGFGWLFAYLVMSGSPVAASALTFFDAGVVDKLEAYTMITGSRLGASFIVLFIGFILVIRGRNRSESLGLGLLSLNVTGSTYLIALAIGYPLLGSGLLDGMQVHSGKLLSSATDHIIDPVARVLSNVFPQWALFVVGLGIILMSFALFDRCLPEATLKESHFGRMSRLIYRPWVMFLIGGLITLVSMSVSVSLGVLVPLSARGFVRRENLIPYIMGANITTFVDTLLAAVLLRNPDAFTVVLVEMISVAMVSVFVLTLIYRRFEHGMLSFVGWLVSSNRNLALFMITMFSLPVLLMLV